MKVDVLENYELLSEHAANTMVDQIRTKTDSVIGMASGETTRLTYELFSKKNAGAKDRLFQGYFYCI